MLHGFYVKGQTIVLLYSLPGFLVVLSCPIAIPDPYLLFRHSLLIAYLDPPLSFHCSDVNHQ